MRDPQECRSLSRKCRERAKTAIDRDIIDQLRLWAVELADQADEIERRSKDTPSGAIGRLRNSRDGHATQRRAQYSAILPK